MSFPEVLDAARALPRDEQLRLAQVLLDPVAEQQGLEMFPEHLRYLIPPNGSVIEYREPITTDAAGWAVIEEMMRSLGRYS